MVWNRGEQEVQDLARVVHLRLSAHTSGVLEALGQVGVEETDA